MSAKEKVFNLRDLSMVFYQEGIDGRRNIYQGRTITKITYPGVRLQLTVAMVITLNFADCRYAN